VKPYTEQKFEKVFPWFEAINLNLLKAPISIVLLVTDVCACRCNMCTHWTMDERYSLDYETFRSIMLACQENGTQSVFLSGGDCFWWEHWERFLKDEEIKLAIQITTPLIIPKSFDRQLLRRLKWLRVSYDAIKPETFKKIRGVDALKKALTDLEHIVKNNLIEDVGMTTCLQRDNCSEILEMGEYLVSLGIKRWIVQLVNYHHNLRISQEEVVATGHWLMEKFGEDIPINNFEVLTSDFKEWKETKNLPCIIPRMEAFIDTRLRVWPCCNIAQDSLGDEERVDELMMGRIPKGSRAGSCFLELWRERRNYLDKFPDFKKIHRLCEYTCQFKYFYYNQGFEHCRKSRKVIYI